MWLYMSLCWCILCNRSKRTQRPKFKPLMWLLAFPIAPILLEEASVQTFSLQLWAHSKAD